MDELKISKEFYELLFDRVKNDIGGFLVDADLKQIVEKAMNKALFERTETRGGQWGTTVTFENSKFVKLIGENCKEQVSECIKNWLVANEALVTLAIKETVEAGVFGMIKSHFENKSQVPLANLINQLAGKGLI